MKQNLNAKQIKTAITLVTCLLLLSSCSDKEELIGLWDDNIHLSTKQVNFGPDTESVIITTGGDWWWIDSIVFQDSCYTYHDREDIDLEADSYTIQEDNFTVERREKNNLYIEMNTNNTGNQRTMYITLEAGDYFDHVTINQSSH